MYIIGAALVFGCTKKPNPGPAPAKDNGSKDAIADGARGRGHSFDAFDKPFASRVTAIEYIPIFFDLNGTIPLPDSRETIETIIEEADKYTACRVTGHACPLGSRAYNQALGKARADAVVGLLRGRGVRVGFQVQSYGEDSLLADDPLHYHLNRRVTVECEK